MKKLPLMTALLITSQVSANTLESVTVTAERHEQPQVDASISVIDQLESYQSIHISEVMASSPATMIVNASGQEQLTALRSPVMTGAGDCGAFLMSEDNIPLRSPAFCNINQLFDTFYEMADRIEVLRGPGTVFHGSNAVHGMVNVISPAFSDAPQTTLSFTDTSHGHNSLGLDHRTDNFIAQSLFKKDQGYKKDSGYEQQKLRLKGLQQGDNWQLTHNLSYMNLEQDSAGYVIGSDAYRDDSQKQTNGTPDAYRNAESLRLWSEWRFQPKAQSELIFSPYLRSNKMDFLMHFQPGDPLEKSGHDSIGFQAAFVRPYDKRTRLTTGFDADYTQGYLKQQQQNTFTPDSVQFPTGDHYDFDVDVYTIAMFIQSEITLKDNWDMTLGMRLEHTRFDYRNNLRDGNICGSSPCRYYRPADDIVTFYDASPTFSSSYSFNQQHSTFVSLKRAYRAPQATELFRLEQDQQLAKIDSEELDAVEWGFKGSFPQLSYQVSLYAMEKDNVIVKNADRQTVDGQQTSHQGIEASLYWSILENWWLSGQFSYAEHRYDSNSLLLGSSGNLKNNLIDSAPRHLHNVQLGWDMTDTGKLSSELIYVGNYYLNPENSKRYPGHTLLNLRYQQLLPADWKLGVAIMNLGNKDYAERADVQPLSGTERYMIGEPRSFRFSVEKTFR